MGYQSQWWSVPRIPYAVLSAFFVLDKGAELDGTDRRHSTFKNAFPRLRLFTGRDDPAGRSEQFERFYLITVDTSADPIELRAYDVGRPEEVISFDRMLNDLLAQVAERSLDLYEFEDGKISKVSS